MKTAKKFKTLQIDGDVHDAIVRYCKDNGLKISFFVEKTLTNKMEKLINEQRSTTM